MDIKPGMDYTVEVDDDNNLKEVAVSEESKQDGVKEEAKVDTVQENDGTNEPKKKKKKKKNKNKGVE